MHVVLSNDPEEANKGNYSIALVSENGLIRSVSVLSFRIEADKAIVGVETPLRDEGFFSIDSSEYSGFICKEKIILAKLSKRSAKELQIKWKNRTQEMPVLS